MSPENPNQIADIFDYWVKHNLSVIYNDQDVVSPITRAAIAVVPSYKFRLVINQNLSRQDVFFAYFAGWDRKRQQSLVDEYVTELNEGKYLSDRVIYQISKFAPKNLLFYDSQKIDFAKDFLGIGIACSYAAYRNTIEYYNIPVDLELLSSIFYFRPDNYPGKYVHFVKK